MAKEEKTLGLGEISTIRDILMGQQINEFQKKFDEVNDKNVALEKMFEQKVQTLEKDMKSKMDELEKGMSARFDKLEALLKDNVNNLESKLSSSSKNDKELLGQMLQEVGNKLLNGG